VKIYHNNKTLSDTPDRSRVIEGGVLDAGGGGGGGAALGQVEVRLVDLLRVAVLDLGPDRRFADEREEYENSSQEVEDVQDGFQCEHLGAVFIFQVGRHDVQYPGYPHNDGQLDDDREVIHQPVRATCLYCLHGVPVFGKMYRSDQETDDVEGDEHNHDQVEVEECRVREERCQFVVLLSNETLKIAHVWERNVAWFESVKQENDDGNQNWDSLGVQKVHKETLQA